MGLEKQLRGKKFICLLNEDDTKNIKSDYNSLRYLLKRKRNENSRIKQIL